MPLGENLKNVRESRNMTQKELAGRVQVNSVNICYFENGYKIPSVATLVRIADVLNCSTDYLLDREKFINRKEN